jgi:phosphate transport system substrate-binding protein
MVKNLLMGKQNNYPLKKAITIVLLLTLILFLWNPLINYINTITNTGGPVITTINDLEPFTPNDILSGTVRIWGHGSHRRNFMGNLIRRWAKEFNSYYPDITIENRMYGTASAVGALYTGVGDIALLGEEISPEATAAFQREKGYSPTNIMVATGSLDVNFFDYAHMIFVHKDNPITGLSVDQLERVFGAEHKRANTNIRRWGQLGLTGDWADRPIQPYGWKIDVDFALFFRERILLDSHRWNNTIEEFVHLKPDDGSQYDHGQRILDALAHNPNGIAISNIRYQIPEVKPLPLSWHSNTPFIEASEKTLINQSYPLVRVIPAIIDRPPDQDISPPVREFLRYILSQQGQLALVEETGYLPLNQTIVTQQMEKLQ